MTVAELERVLKACPQPIAIRLLGIAPRTLRNRIRDGDYVAPERGRVNVFDALAKERDRTARAATPATDARVRYLNAQTKLKDLEHAQAAGELIPAGDVEELYFETLQIVASGLDGLGASLAPKVVGVTDPLEAQRIISDETRRLRERMAERLEQGGEPTETGDS